MIKLKEKDQCCGCSACATICPKNCIKMVPDEEGFLYPKVNVDECINCQLCEKVCPMNNVIDVKPTKGYIIQSNEDRVLNESSSGGFFTYASREIIQQNGVVYGALIDYTKKMVYHDRICSIDDISKLRGSKYVQSNLNNVFNLICNDLIDDKIVLFSGTSCQINGLFNFLNIKKIDCSKLYTIDIVCHGVPSPMLFKKYMEYQETKYKSKISYINFRYKTYGYHSGTMKVLFENNKKYYASARTDFMLKSFFSEISSRYSCYSCKFKTLNRLSDITIFDGWHFSNYTDELDNDRGYTCVIINSENGVKFFNNIKEKFKCYDCDFNEMIKMDGSMYHNSAIPHQNRGLYLKSISKDGLYNASKKYLKIRKRDYLIERLKKIYYFKKKIK